MSSFPSPVARMPRAPLLLCAAVLAAVSSSNISAKTIVVNDDSSTLHDPGCAATGTGTCTLADAVAFANASAGPDEIHFAIPGEGVHAITGDFQITDAVTIDGYTQPGASVNTNGPGLGDNAVLKIEVQGCFDIGNGPTTIRGLVINRCSGSGVWVHGDTDQTPFRTIIQGNFIGTDPTGTSARPNGGGIYLEPCETIVGAAPDDSIPQAAAARNLISGNTHQPGITLIYGPIRVAGNFIGTDATGTKAIPNGGGIYFYPYTSDPCLGAIGRAVIGGSRARLGNLISGNGAGIQLEDVADPKIEGNLIGTDVTGSVALPNAVGISSFGSPSIGGQEPRSGNVISGNTSDGISIFFDTNTYVEGNRIGTDLTGKHALGNGGTGIAASPQGFIRGNLVDYNGAAGPVGGGVGLENPSHFLVALAITGNSLLGNTSDGTLADRGLGIDLLDDGPTANDDCDAEFVSQGFDYQNKPVLIGAISSSSGTQIQGSLNSKPSALFHIEFFSNAKCDPSGSGPGEVFLGSIEISTNDSCLALIDTKLPIVVLPDHFVTSTATEISEQKLVNTSELSNCVAVATALFDVTSIVPASGPKEGQANVGVQGLGFQSRAAVSVGGADFVVSGSSPDIAITGSVPTLAPGGLYDVVVTNPDTSTARLPHGWLADFSDVPGAHPFHGAVERIFRKGITSGCGGGNFCPDQIVDRGQVAAFLARALAAGDGSKVPSAGTVNGAPYDCKAGGVSLFSDVAPTDPFCKHVHWLAAWEVTLGCSPSQFCPSALVNRAGMAGLVARALIAPDWMPVPSTYGPDPVTSRSYSCVAASPNVHFSDVPATDPFCKHVHYLWARGVVSGCSTDQFCPADVVTRGPMAKFLANAFAPEGP